MIFDCFLEILCEPLISLLLNLPDISIGIPDGTFDQIGGFFQCLGYVCPIGTVTVILGLKASCWSFKIIMALIVRIKSFVPFWGS